MTKTIIQDTRLPKGLLLIIASIAPALGSEYQLDENPAPKAVDEIETVLGNITTEFEPSKRVVFNAIDEWRQKQAPFIRDGQTRYDFRSYDFDGSDSGKPDRQSWVAGGELSYRSGKWRDILAVGASWYGSFEINGNSDAGRTSLVQSNGDNISVIGQAFAEVSWNGLQGRFFRQELDLPYINRNDSRQIPNTFEAYGLGRKGAELDFVIGHIDKIKGRADDRFISMTEAAGGAGSAGTSVAGMWWAPADGRFDIGAVFQITDDSFSTTYSELSWELPVTEGLGLKLDAQYTDQRSVGADRLGNFRTDTWGTRVSASYLNAILTLAFTNTDSGAAIRSPFGGRPSYLSSMINDFDRANERAWRLGLSVHFDRFGLPGLSALVNASKGRHAIDATSLQPLPDRTEYDYTIDFRPERGALEGFWLRIRYARLDEDGSGKVSDQIRIILNYSLPIL